MNVASLTVFSPCLPDHAVRAGRSGQIPRPSPDVVGGCFINLNLNTWKKLPQDIQKVLLDTMSEKGKKVGGHLHPDGRRGKSKAEGKGGQGNQIFA